MSEQETDSWRWSFLIICFLILFPAVVCVCQHSSDYFVFYVAILKLVAGASLDTDREVLLQLKSYLDNQTLADTGKYIYWNTNNNNPCTWWGIFCSSDRKRVIGIDLSDSNISGEIYKNFSLLTELTYLDLSKNTVSGEIPADLRLCQKLVYLNISHNILRGNLNLTGLKSLKTLDLSVNRIYGELGLSFPAICDNLVTLNISGNNLTGGIDNNVFDQCYKLQHLDLSTNGLSGGIWMKFARLKEFSVSENYLLGSISASAFTNGICNLEELDLSENGFFGMAPKEIPYCKNLVILNLSSNNFTGDIPVEWGSISGLQALYLADNSFSREIPEALLNLTNLTSLDLSRNSFGGEIQKTFGKLKQVKSLMLHSNNYTEGLNSSGILQLPNILQLDLSYNDLSGLLPVEISQMSSLKSLLLACNDFSGSIPHEFGNLPNLQALDLSSNRLNGSIPPSLGKLTSLLWLMLANNALTGEIPPELGNCSSLLWLNLANNKLTGNFPSELTYIGRNSTAAFESNWVSNDRITVGSGQCLAMKRWIPADYPPFSFVYTILSKKNCRNIWDRLLKGHGIFPMCEFMSTSQLQQISGYVQLSGNQLTGEIPHEIGRMMNFDMLLLGYNEFSGKIPIDIGGLSLVVLNMTRNEFSGEIPMEIGKLKCLSNLDLSYNNFSGTFPTSLNNLTDLSKFNISYNPLISGLVPSTGQLTTFGMDSYYGDPLLNLPKFIDNITDGRNTTARRVPTKSPRKFAFSGILAFTLAFLVFGFLSLGISSLLIC